MQVRIKAFLAKVRCYNKCVKMAKTDAESKLKNCRRENKSKKISSEASGGTLKETPMLTRSAAAVSLTLKENNGNEHSLERATYGTANIANKSSSWKNSSRDFPLSAKSATMPNQPLSKGYRVIGTKHQRAGSNEFLSQWNTDSEFLVTDSRYANPSRRKRSYTATSHLMVEPRKKHSSYHQEWGYLAASSPQGTHGNAAFNSVRHSTPQDRELIHDTLSMVRSKLHPQETYRKRPVLEESSAAESTESDITPSLFNTTQDDILTCSSFTSYEHKSTTTEDETSTQDYSTCTSVDERDTTVDSENFPEAARVLDCAVPEINPISILSSFKNYFQEEQLPDLSSEVSTTFRDHDTLMGSVTSDRKLERRESGSTIICSSSHTTALESLDTGSASSRKPYDEQLTDSEVPSSYQELGTPVESESRSRSTVIESGPTESTIGSKDYTQNPNTRLEDHDVSNIVSNIAVQTDFSNTAISDRECTESVSERDHSSIDYPVKSNTDFEEYAVSEIASTCDNGNWQSSNVLLDSCRDQTELPQAGVPLQYGGYIECSPHAHRRSGIVASDEFLNTEQNSGSEQYAPSNCSLNQLPESEVPGMFPEERGYTSSALSLPLHAEQGSYNCDFEHSAYNAYQHIIDTTESEFGPPKKCSTPKKRMRKSSMKDTFLQKLPEGSGDLRERSVSVKSVRFSADSPSIGEPMGGEGYYHQSSSSTGYLQHTAGQYVRLCQSPPHHHEEYYSPTPVRHDYYPIDNCDSNQMFGSRLLKPSATCSSGSEDHSTNGGSHAKQATRDIIKHEVQKENFDPEKKQSHRAYPDTTKLPGHDGILDKAKKQYPVRQKESGIELDPRTKHEPHFMRNSELAAARSTSHAKRTATDDDMEVVCTTKNQSIPSTYQGTGYCEESEKLSPKNHIVCESSLVSIELNTYHDQMCTASNPTKKKGKGSRRSKVVNYSTNYFLAITVYIFFS